MNTAEPIREKRKLQQLAAYYEVEKPNPRNRLLIVVALNTALRISDVLSLRWQDVYDTEHKKFWQHLKLVEAKTGKKTSIYMNARVQEALRTYMKWKKRRTMRRRFFISGKKWRGAFQNAGIPHCS